MVVREKYITIISPRLLHVFHASGIMTPSQET
jgi:hypothetical protein